MEQNKRGTAAQDEKKTKEQKVRKQLGRSALPLNYLMQQRPVKLYSLLLPLSPYNLLFEMLHQATENSQNKACRSSSLHKFKKKVIYKENK